MKKALGIIGGMGPLAAADFLMKIVTLTDASSDREHVRVYLDNNTTVPDRSKAFSGGASPVPAIMDSVRKLEQMGADCLAMTCNTAHFFLPELQSQTRLPFISIIDATAAECAARFPGGTACVLATDAVVDTGLYHRALESRGVKAVSPDAAHRRTVMELIYKVKEGTVTAAEVSAMADILEKERARGADCFILGCTELPVLTAHLHAESCTVNSTAALARAAIEYCGYKVRR